MRQTVAINDNGGEKRQGCTMQPLKAPRSHASYKEEIDRLKSEVERLQQAHRQGWEQAKMMCAEITDRYSVRDDVALDIKKAISAMEYEGESK